MPTYTQLIIRSALVAACFALAAAASLDPARVSSEAKRFDQLAASGQETAVQRELSVRYAKLAGSQFNALRLVSGLRNGTTIRLQLDAERYTEIRPSVDRLSYGRVFAALARAEAELAQRRGDKWPAPPKEIDRAVRKALASLPVETSGDRQLTSNADPKGVNRPDQRTDTTRGADPGGNQTSGGHPGGGGTVFRTGQNDQTCPTCNDALRNESTIGGKGREQLPWQLPSPQQSLGSVSSAPSTSTNPNFGQDALAAGAQKDLRMDKGLGGDWTGFKGPAFSPQGAQGADKFGSPGSQFDRFGPTGTAADRLRFGPATGAR